MTADSELLEDLRSKYTEGEDIRRRALEEENYEVATFMTTKLTVLANIIAELAARNIKSDADRQES